MPDLSIFILGDRIVPVGASDRARWGRLPRGPELTVSIKHERSRPQHRMVMKLCAAVAEAMRDGPDGMADIDDETVRTDIMCGAGYARVRPMTLFERAVYNDAPQGSVIGFRQSLSFDAMDGTAFGQFADRAAGFLADVHGDWLFDSLPGRQAIDILRKMGHRPGDDGFR